LVKVGGRETREFRILRSKGKITGTGKVKLSLLSSNLPEAVQHWFTIQSFFPKSLRMYLTYVYYIKGNITIPFQFVMHQS
jgi:hypothetical protein